MNGRILALLPDERIRRTALRVLVATRSEIVEVEDLVEARLRLGEREFDLALLDQAGCPAGEPLEFLKDAGHCLSPMTQVMLLADRLEPLPLADLLGTGLLTHLVGKANPFDTTELLISCEKVLRGDLFGMEKYLDWGIEPESVLIRAASDRELALERLTRYIEPLQLTARLLEVSRGIADEFLMNAVYNAPVDAHGQRLNAHRSRTEKLILEPGQEALFRFASDGRWLALSIRDPFGSLERDDLFRNLTRCLRQGDEQISDKAGGAGMGLYFIYSAANQFIINLAPGRVTEMIALLDVSSSFRTYAARPKSFNLFIGGMRPGG